MVAAQAPAGDEAAHALARGTTPSQEVVVGLAERLQSLVERVRATAAQLGEDLSTTSQGAEWLSGRHQQLVDRLDAQVEQLATVVAAGGAPHDLEQVRAGLAAILEDHREWLLRERKLDERLDQMRARADAVADDLRLEPLGEEVARAVEVAAAEQRVQAVYGQAMADMATSVTAALEAATAVLLEQLVGLRGEMEALAEGATSRQGVPPAPTPDPSASGDAIREVASALQSLTSRLTAEMSDLRLQVAAGTDRGDELAEAVGALADEVQRLRRRIPLRADAGDEGGDGHPKGRESVAAAPRPGDGAQRRERPLRAAGRRR